MTMPHLRQKLYGDLDNWWSEPNGTNTCWTYKESRHSQHTAERLAVSIESALGIPTSIKEQREGDEVVYWIETGYRPNCHLEGK